MARKKSMKPFFEHKFSCPNCGKIVRVKAVRRVVAPATPAVVELDVFTELETQTTLPTASTEKEDS